MKNYICLKKMLVKLLPPPPHPPRHSRSYAPIMCSESQNIRTAYKNFCPFEGRFIRFIPKYFLFFFYLLFSIPSFGQTNCQNAVQMLPDSIYEIYFAQGHSEAWIYFIKSDTIAQEINFATLQSGNSVTSIAIYSGTCEELALFDYCQQADSVTAYRFVTDTAYSVYFLKLMRNDTTLADTIELFESLAPNSCYISPTGCNMIGNHDFETYNNYLSYYLITILGGAINNLDYNIICNWKRGWGTPDVGPLCTTGWHSNPYHYIYMWTRNISVTGVYDIGEAVFQDINGLVPGNHYRLEIEYSTGSHSANQNNLSLPVINAEFSNYFTVPTLIFNQLGQPKPANYNTLFPIGTGITQPSQTIPYWQTMVFPRFQFNQNMFASQPYSRLVVYPTQSYSQDVEHVDIMIKNVKLVPDEEIIVNISSGTNCEVYATVGLTGNYTNVIFDWYDDISMTNIVASNTPTFTHQIGHSIKDLWVKATYNNGECIAVDKVTFMEVQPNLTIEDVVLCPPQVISGMFVINLTGGTAPYTYQWSPADGLSGTTISNPTVSLTTPGIYPYSLLVTDANGCTVTAQAEVMVKEAKVEIDGKRSLCDPLPFTYTYYVVNPDPNMIYTWSLNVSGSLADFVGGINTGTLVDIEFNSPTLPLPQFIELTVTGTGSNQCETNGIFRIYECCDIDVDTIINDDVLTQSMMNNKQSVLLQGVITINNSVSINNQSLMMGPEAKIVVLPGASLNITTNYNTTLKKVAAGCDVMWDGIYVEDISSVITVDESKIEDAINAIVSKNGGGFIIENSIFENNYIGIDVMDYHSGTPAYPSPSQPHSGAVSGTIFRSWDDVNYLLYMPPLSGIPVFCGIRANMVDDLTVGNHQQGSGQNLFENMEFGIYANDSYLSCYNNKFQNIKPNLGLMIIGTIKPKGAISSFFGINQAIPINKQLVAGLQQTGSSNEFFDCTYGIDAYNLKLIARNNFFEDINQTCINLVIFRNGSLIDYNVISNSHTGIRAENLFPSGHAIDILENEIGNVVNGIVSINAGYNAIALPDNWPGYYLRVFNNEILLNETLPWVVVRSGVIIHNCAFANVGCNKIYMLNPPSQTNHKRHYRGVWCSQSMHASIYDNWTINLGCGIYTTGIQTNTRYFCNNLYGGYHGIFFGSSTLLTNQGWQTPNGGWNTHNSFTNQIETKLATDLGNILNPVTIGTWSTYVQWFYFPNQGQQYLPEAQGTSIIEDYINDVSNNNANHACGTSSQTPHCPLPSPGNQMLADLTADERDHLFADLLLMEEIYLQLNEEYHGYNAEYLFTILFNDSSLMYLGGDLDNEYKSFYDSLKNEPISSFVEMEMLFNEGDFGAARDVNESITPLNNLEEYRQNVNTILFSTWIQGQYHFTPEDSAYLHAIATLTPYEGGYAVYTARVMLGLDPQENEVAYRKPPPVTGKRQDVAKVYPNPTRELITVEFLEETELENCFIEFYSVHGQKQLIKEIHYLNQNISVGELPIGIHFYRIINNSSIIQTGKLVVRP